MDTPIASIYATIDIPVIVAGDTLVYNRGGGCVGIKSRGQAKERKFCNVRRVVVLCTGDVVLLIGHSEARLVRPDGNEYTLRGPGLIYRDRYTTVMVEAAATDGSLSLTERICY